MKVRNTSALVALLAFFATALPAQKAAFSPEKFWDIQRLEMPEISPDGRTITYTRWIPNQSQNRWDATIWQVNANGGGASQISQGRNAQWAPDGLRIAYLTNMDGREQLMVRVVKSGEVKQLTSGPNSPEQFHWSPDGKRIAFTEQVADSSQVLQLFQRRTSRRQLFIVSPDEGTARQVTTGSMSVGANDRGDAGLTVFSWFPDNRNIAFDGNDSPSAATEYASSTIFFVDVETGKTGRLTSAPGFWHAPVVSPDGRWIAYQGFSDDGSSYHVEDLYVVSPDGKTFRVLTKDLERDPVGVVWATDNLSLWFSAEDRGTINVYNAPLAGSAKLVSNGSHSVVVHSVSARDGGFGVAVRDAFTEPDEIVRFALKKPSDLKPVTAANAGLASQINWGEIEELKYRAAGASLQGWLIRPPSFQLSRQYPLVVELHDGPHAMFSATFDPALQALSGAGYLVLRLNPRGSTGFGSEISGGLAGGFPGAETDDVLSGIRAAIDNGGVDTTRIYLDGCGAGAVSALQLLTRVAPFGAATIRCPSGAWLPLTGAAEVAQAERPFFSRPFRQDPLEWAEHSPVRFASSIRTPILVLAGRCDLDAPFSISRTLGTALQLRRSEVLLESFDDECRGTTSRPLNWLKTIRARLTWYGMPAHKS